MINKIVKALGVALLCFLTTATFAGAALDEHNVAMEVKAAQIEIEENLVGGGGGSSPPCCRD